MSFLHNFCFWLANRCRQCQRENQQGEDNAECDVEPTEHRCNQGTTDAADTEAKVNHTVVFCQVVQTEEFTDQRWEDGDGTTEVKGDAGNSRTSFSGANSSAAIPTREIT